MAGVDLQISNLTGQFLRPFDDGWDACSDSERVRGMLKGWVGEEVREGVIQLLRQLMGINTKVLEHPLRDAIGLLHQRPEHMFNVKLEVLAGADLAIRLSKGRLRRGGEPVKVIATVWFNAARTNVTGVDRLEEGFERRVRNVEGAAGFDGAEAAVINPIVDDLTGDLEVRRNIVGGEVVGSHDPSLLLDYNR